MRTGARDLLLLRGPRVGSRRAAPRGRRLLALGLLWAGGVFAAPVLVVDPVTYDWGRQAENQGEYSFRFVLANRGDAALEITQVRPTCSCTTVTFALRTLAAGESAELTGVLSTKGIDGLMQKGILISSSDPAQPTAVATLRIRFPLNGQGLRLRSAVTAARLVDGTLQANVLVENCEERTVLQIQAMELPDGWDCPARLPVSVPAEERVVLPLVCKLAPGADPEPFENTKFAFITNSATVPRVDGLLLYRRLEPAPPSPAAPK